MLNAFLEDSKGNRCNIGTHKRCLSYMICAANRSGNDFNIMTEIVVIYCSYNIFKLSKTIFGNIIKASNKR